jgi:hypothetical protein
VVCIIFQSKPYDSFSTDRDSSVVHKSQFGNVGGRVFNLLVKYEPWGEGRDSMPVGRILEYTDEALVERLKPNEQLDVETLIALPCLFAEESNGSANQVARIGNVYRARRNGPDLTFDFSYDQGIAPIPQDVLRNHAAEFEMADFEFSRTHWAVKDSDLFRILLKYAVPRRQKPKVFQLSEFEKIERSLVSVMMPFDPRFDRVYEVLGQSALAAGLRCRRADDIWENPAIIQDVVSLIDRSRVVICDCTGRNPNVFYEIGIAHTLGRDVILITQLESDIPFDLRHLRYMKYLNNGEGLSSLQSLLVPRLTHIAQNE